MKNIFVSTYRLFVAYAKFGVMIFSLSLMNAALKSDNGFIYLSSASQFLKLGGIYVSEQQNIRKKKYCPKNFLNLDKKLNLNALNINHEQNRRSV